MDVKIGSMNLSEDVEASRSSQDTIDRVVKRSLVRRLDLVLMPTLGKLLYQVPPSPKSITELLIEEFSCESTGLFNSYIGPSKSRKCEEWKSGEGSWSQRQSVLPRPDALLHPLRYF